MDKFISILIPTFNRKDKLIRAIRSIENSTYKDVEVIVFNDASTDGTINELNEYKKNSKLNIEVIDSKEKRYKHGAMNVLFEECKSKYAFLLDDDDELTPNAIEDALNTFLTLPNNDEYCTVVGRCISSIDNKLIGPKYPEDINFETWSKSSKIASKISGEKFSLFNVEALKKYKMPEPKGITFISEYIFWCKVQNDYREYYTNDVYRIYHQNEGECLSDINHTYQYFKNKYFESVYFLNGLKSQYSRFKNLKFKTLIKLALIYLKIIKVDKKIIKINNIGDKFLLFLLWPIMILGLIKYRK